MNHLDIQVRKDARSRAVAEFVAAWKKAKAGEKVTPSDRLYFSDWSTFASVFTPRRVELLLELRREPADGIRTLARRLDRDLKNVHSDVQALVTVGLIEKGGARLTAPYSEVGAALSFAT